MHLRSISRFVIVAALAGAFVSSFAQQLPPASADPDSSVVEVAPVAARTPAQLRAQAWAILSDGASDSHPESRIQALAALGLINNARSLALILAGMHDKDVDVRMAAVLAAGQTRSTNAATPLRAMLDDKEPAVDFAAALALWKMHDRSGEDILTAVAIGERRTSAKILNSTTHTIHKQLQDPVGIAKYGAMQGISMVLGPFGIGLAAFEWLHKNGGDSARIAAIEAIAQNHTAPIRAELIAATTDKDAGVRTAACKALARYRNPDVPPALAIDFEDTKAPVRLTAAAGYLISTGAVVGSPVEGDLSVRSRSK